MADFNFPPTPVLNQEHVEGGVTYVWNGYGWAIKVVSATVPTAAAEGVQVNGGFEVSEEHGTTAVVLTNGYGYVLDSWAASAAGISGLSASVAQVAEAPPGFSHSMKYSVLVGVPLLAAGEGGNIYQPIEGNRIKRLSWGTPYAQPLTIGFWTKIHRPGAYSLGVQNGAADRAYAILYNHNSADVWEFKTFIVPGDTAGLWPTGNDVGMYLDFTIAAPAADCIAPNAWTSTGLFSAAGQINGVEAAGDDFQIAGVVVLPGAHTLLAAQVPLLMRPVDQESLTCMRYYEKGYFAMGGYSGGVFDMSSSEQFRVIKRAPPTAIVLSNQVANGMVDVLNYGTGSITNKSFIASLGQTTAAGAFIGAFDWAADSRLG